MPRTDRVRDMFSSRFKRHAAQFAISAALAVVTPAAAAGLVEGVRVAATTVDQAANVPTAAADDSAALVATPQAVQIAAHDPLPLSALAVRVSAPAAAKPVHESDARNPTP